jgi:Kef-type K+ transport system membrane component KefB
MGHLIEFVRSHALALPTIAKFAVALAVIVGIPLLSRRVRLPAVVGFLLSGVLFGPHGLGLIGENRPIADFFGELGKLLLMFCAGLEINLVLFRQERMKTTIFGLLTMLLPLLLGTAVGLLFGYRPIPAVVLGSLLASHTLLAYPIVTRLGETGLEPVTITAGATMLSDTLSLIVFAICVPMFQSGFSVSALAVQLIEIAIFFPLVLFGLSRLGAYVLRKVGNHEDAYFVTMLAILAVAALLSQIINLPGIVGAFLAGLAVNASVHDKPAKEKLEFFGNSLFIPIFFIVTGFLINPMASLRSLTSDFGLVAAVIGALVAGKWVAAEIAGRAFRYSSDARLTMWSLTLPQVASTLAATLVAFNTFNPAGQRLVDTRLINVVLILVLSTSILGPILTEHFAPRLLGNDAKK